MKHSWLVVAVASAALMSCATPSTLGKLGFVDASSDPALDALPGPVPHGDLEATTARGQMIVAHMQATLLAEREGLSRVGYDGVRPIVSLVDLDPGYRSGQVVFLRWPRNGPTELHAVERDRAERWLLVSEAFAPDRVLDVEQIHGELGSDHPELARASGVLAVHRELQKLHPALGFRLIEVRERHATGSHRVPHRIVQRVYAFAQDNTVAADHEFEIGDVPRQGLPEITATHVHHARGALTDQTIRTELVDVGPMSIARAMWLRPESGNVRVVTKTNQAWMVSATTGKLEPAP